MAKRKAAAKIAKSLAAVLDHQMERARGAGKTVKRGAGKATTTVREVGPPSPNPMTNLVIADVLMRGGGAVLRRLVETSVLKTQYSDGKAKSVIKGRGMLQTLLGTAVARVATRSVPGAIVVGGGLLAKTLYDRRRGAAAKEEGEKAVAKQAAKAD